MAARDYELLLKISADIRNAVGPLNKLSRELHTSGDKGSRSLDRVNKSLERIGRQATSVKSILAGAFAALGIKRMVGNVVQANIAMQRIHYGLLQAFGSSKAAAEQFKFLSDTSQRLGLNLKDVSEGYVQIAASAQGTGVSGQALQKVFVGMSEAATVLHTSTADVAGVFTQLSQGISLGKLHMQDIRAIAQHLPGTMEVLDLAAKRLGTTLQYSLAHGGLDAKKMLESIGVVLHERFGKRAAEASHSLNAEINRLHTAIFDLETQAGENGFLDSFTQSIRDLTTTLQDPGVQRGFSGLMQAMGAAIKVAVKLAQSIGGISNAVGYITRRYAASQTGYIDQSQPLKDQQEEFNALVAQHRANQEELAILEKNDRSPDGKPGYRLQLLRKEDAALMKEIQAAQEAHKQAIIHGQKDTQDAMKTAAGNFIDSIIGTSKGIGAQGPDKAAIARAKRMEAAQMQLANVITSLGNRALGPVSKLWNDYASAVRRAAEAGGKAIANGADVGYIQQQVAKAVALANQARAEGLAKINQGLNIDLLKATGQTARASRLEIEREYAKLEQDLIASGDQAGAQLVRRLINVRGAAAQMKDLYAQVQRIQADQQRQATTIQAEQTAGARSEYSARKAILDLNQKTAAQLAQLLPLLRQAAAATGDPAAIARVKDLAAEIDRLKLKANDLKIAFEGGLTSGLEDALNGLANRTYTVAGAFRALAQSVISSLTQVAARALAAKAISGLESLFGGGQKKDVGAGARQLASASTLLGINAGKLQIAASTLLAANKGGSAGGAGGGSSASGYIGAAASIIGMFADGGAISGPGTGTSDSMLARVSNGEFVQRAAAVDYYGASFMHAINNLQLPRFASGGLVGSDAPRLRSPALPRAAVNAPMAPGQGGPAIMQRIVNVVDPNLVGGYLRGTGGRDDVINIISDNASSVRQALGV